ncbi:hypothetical protein CN096_31910, partial [Sinorhizobium meliloti]
MLQTDHRRFPVPRPRWLQVRPRRGSSGLRAREASSHSGSWQNPALLAPLVVKAASAGAAGRPGGRMPRLLLESGSKLSLHRSVSGTANARNGY